MPKKQAPGFDESSLNKGQVRKLTALRKSLGTEIADEAFARWLAEQPAKKVETEDANAAMIADALGKLVESKGLRIPKTGYMVKRGRGRVIVSKPAA